MMRWMIALSAGLLFGWGLIFANMIDPAVVLAFLDVTGAWNPTLAFVLGGAVLTTALGYRVVWRRDRPKWAAAFSLPLSVAIDLKLTTGAALFGCGWGLVGLCPGPAIVGLTLGYPEVFIFVAAMLVGMLVARVVASNGSAPLMAPSKTS